MSQHDEVKELAIDVMTPQSVCYQCDNDVEYHGHVGQLPVGLLLESAQFAKRLYEDAERKLNKALENVELHIQAYRRKTTTLQLLRKAALQAVTQELAEADSARASIEEDVKTVVMRAMELKGKIGG